MTAPILYSAIVDGYVIYSFNRFAEDVMHQQWYRNDFLWVDPGQWMPPDVDIDSEDVLVLLSRAD